MLMGKSAIHSHSKGRKQLQRLPFGKGKGKTWYQLLKHRHRDSRFGGLLLLLLLLSTLLLWSSFTLSVDATVEVSTVDDYEEEEEKNASGKKTL